MAKQAVIFMLGVLLWAAQCLFVVHEFEHLAAHDEQEICELCLVATGLDQPVAVAHSHAMRFDIAFLPNFYHSNAQFETYLAVQARGPPSGSIG
ncbi:MAG: hypothetical protein V2J55_07875 [Candidatus Competibacteraceae bacterium]|jgi:hypothetical protein|nr:hypothetical protein [Candidatus Competibacteraceae bacterium]